MDSVHKISKNRILIFLLLAVAIAPNAYAFVTAEELGRALFFDVNLSKNRTQACATCHAPQQAFIDPRTNASGYAVSLGDDNQSLGDRNTPTLSYIALTPTFKIKEDNKYVGGMFLDGREEDLTAQAKRPFLDTTEMAMPSPDSVVNRVKENTSYVTSLKNLFGEDVFSNNEKVFNALAKSIAEFEKTEFFSPFDSKYDRYLRGEYEMSAEEELGMTLFFSKQFTNCNICHQLKPAPHRESETFSNYEFHNIGVPENQRVRKVNGKPTDYIDTGLLNHPLVKDPQQAGKFKVPTLRNVAVTPPYMHNGIFKHLRTVILFYNKYNSKNAQRQINPESGEEWQAPEVGENISLKELQTGPALDDRRIDALVAFLETLTDKRYEHLLENE